jgi:hypothetical protein
MTNKHDYTPYFNELSCELYKYGYTLERVYRLKTKDNEDGITLWSSEKELCDIERFLSYLHKERKKND